MDNLSHLNYKVLLTGEQLLEGDQYWSLHRKEWLPIESPKTDRTVTETFSGLYRRITKE